MLVHLQGVDPNIRDIIKRAVEIHGHLGPFLVFGLRMGLMAEKLLGEKAQRCEFEAINKIPYLCAVDGIKSVIGENAVILKEGKGITVTFRGSNGKQTIIKMRENIMRKYANVAWEKCEESAYEVLRENEEKLFEVC
jgi:formylmethanofuran dehydrogenase subunit E